MLADPRHVGVAFFAGMALMISGAFIFDASNETAMQAVAAVGFVVIFAVFHFLDERARRRKKEQAQ
jgi:ABC-type cobalamin transport system permease subunit